MYPRRRRRSSWARRARTGGVRGTRWSVQDTASPGSILPGRDQDLRREGWRVAELEGAVAVVVEGDEVLPCGEANGAQLFGRVEDGISAPVHEHVSVIALSGVVQRAPLADEARCPDFVAARRNKRSGPSLGVRRQVVGELNQVCIEVSEDVQQPRLHIAVG